MYVIAVNKSQELLLNVRQLKRLFIIFFFDDVVLVQYFSPKFTKCRLAGGLRPDPLRSLSAPPDSLAVAARKLRK